ncbi:MAG: hypothetical protein FJY29_00015 [Betaproteobacteria bacterium]|nr:hypothetical protein [Betaproteobacteria bacterium]
MRKSCNVPFASVFFAVTACGSGGQNSNLQNTESVSNSDYKGRYAISASVVSSKNSGESEYCFLQLRGLGDAELKAEDMGGVTDVAAVYPKSISFASLKNLRSPELRRAVNLANDVRTSTGWRALQADVKQAAAGTGSAGFDCNATADSVKATLGLASPSESSLAFGSRTFWGMCIWACAVVSQPPADYWPTRMPRHSAGQGIELPDYPRRRY